MKNHSINSIFNIIFFQLSINVSKNSVNNLLKKYYYDPGIEEIISLLESWNIKTLVIDNIPVEKLNNAPFPILSYNKNDQLFLVSKIKDGKYECYFQDSKEKESISAKELTKLSSGIYILLEANELSGEINVDEKRIKIKKIKSAECLIIIALMIFIFFGIYKVETSVLRFYILSLLGLFLSIFLLLKEYSFFSEEILDFCEISKKFNCYNVINSRSSNLLGFSLSEISTGFFLFLVSSIIYSNLSNTPMNHITIFVYASGASIVYSIFHQLKMTQYCIICMSISIILLALIGSSLLSYRFNFNLSHISYSTFPLSITLLTLGLTKNYLFFHENARKNDVRISKLLNSSLIINGFRDMQIKNKVFTNNIHLGKAEAPFKIILFMNPSCSKCKRFLKNLPRLVSEFESQIYLRILYSGPKEDNAEPKLIFAKLLNKLELLSDNNKINFLENIDNREMNTDEPFDDQMLNSITNQYLWSNELNLEGTPAIILNDIILPSFFGIEEVCNLIRNIK